MGCFRHELAADNAGIRRLPLSCDKEVHGNFTPDFSVDTGSLTD